MLRVDFCGATKDVSREIEASRKAGPPVSERWPKRTTVLPPSELHEGFWTTATGEEDA